ncbi:MAG: hypothetical protein V4576_02605 [Patescibacteria group bacterium]
MSELTITKIPPENAHQILEEFLSSRSYLPYFFFSPYVLNTFLTRSLKSLYIAEFGAENILLVNKEKLNDIRFLFDHPSTEMIAAVKQYFKPVYMAANQTSTIPADKPYISDIEYEIQLQSIADLTNKSIRKKYNQAIRKNIGLTYEIYKPEHIEGIKAFIEKWNTTRSEEFNKYARTQNDLYFLEQYQNDPKLIGGVVLDKGKVVGYTLCVPALNGKLLAMFNKVLRGYTELGVFLYVERARQLTALGFSEVNIGSINNDFKTHFLENAVSHIAYNYMIHKEVELINDERYLQMLI